MNASVANQKTRMKLHRKGLRNQNEEHIVNLCESNNFESQTPFGLYSYSYNTS